MTILLILSAGITNYAFAQKNYEVRKIVFHGNRTLDKDFLLEGMALKEVSYFEKLLTKNEPTLFSQELMDIDVKRLVSIYQSEGFLNVQAHQDELKINDRNQTVKIVIKINEGLPVSIDSVVIRMASDSAKVNLDSISKKIYRNLKLVKKKRFRDEFLNQDVLTIGDAFKNLGFAYVKVNYTLSLKPEESLTGILYTIDPGPVCQIGQTSLEGNKQVSEKFVRKQIIYRQGELYNESLLSKTRQRLYDLQLFRVVSVLPDKDPETRKTPIPVHIYLEEAPRLTARFGAGYGTEDKFRTFLDLNYHGFLGGARRINLYLKHSALEPYSASLRWIQPQFLSMKSSVSLNPFIMRNSEPGYDTRTYGINVPVTYRFNPRLTSTLTYYFEKVQQFVEAGDTTVFDKENSEFLYNKSGVLVSTVFNNSKPQFSPTQGVNLSFGYRLNGHLFGSDFNYSRLWGEFRTYRKFGEVVLAFRAMAGGIQSADKGQFIPVEDRFYSGGSNSVRGWNRSELGPKRESGTPLGGKSIAEGNLEARYHLFWRISGVAFLDAGNVWTQSYTYNLTKLAYATGGGIRLETPIGPIRFDVGFPVWNEKKSPQFFISVGQAF